ncbi:hypothetical protein ADK67_05450 [Saccharothrix sp. NRRL B-16348]|uniref:hypothetical protein n=1 Tax=Saccharothrix sp. NRRL B-16348 TaxID=1415542 RepID=UPI0006AF45A4|nr:hypothetical protein [Saccharothrix sp. NRRL B-16348]KOX33783.1 hypothetical protein ADK67_05450 [Saccharothrix sp. NRRL B-16348]
MGFQITLTEEQVSQMWAYLARCVNEVESYLRDGDIAGANAFMDEVLNEAGKGCHDLVLDTSARLRGQADWRTFIPYE